MKPQYTIADCPMCGQPFNKHVNAVYCSPRCANKAARDRRMARGPGPDWRHSQSTTDETFKPNYLGSTPIQHTVLESLAKRIITAYTGKKTREGKILHGGGDLHIEVLSPEALGTYQPPYPVILVETPPLTDDEPRRVSMGHYRAFPEEFWPKQQSLPEPTQPQARSILDTLIP